MIVMGVFSMIAMPVIGILIDKWGRIPTILMSLFLGGVGLVLMGVSPNPFSGLIYLAHYSGGFWYVGFHYRGEHPGCGCLTERINRINTGRSQYHAAYWRSLFF